jgi:hypothetical protein
MTAETESQADARKQLLAPATDLLDALGRYQKLLGEDGGMAARLSRSSHRDLFIEPAQRIYGVWKTARADFRGTHIEAAFDRARFVERTERLRRLTDRDDDHPAWDEAIKALSLETSAFIDALVPPRADHLADAAARLQPIRSVFDRYRNLVPFVDVSLLAFRDASASANILSARITCKNAATTDIHHDKNGWVATRRSLQVSEFPRLMDGIAAGHLELADGSFRFPVSNINYSGFRTHTRMFGVPARPRASAKLTAGSISSVTTGEAFYRWRERLAVESGGAYFDLEALIRALDLRTLSDPDEQRQVAVEIEIPLEIRVVSLTQERFDLTFHLFAKKPAMFRGLAILRNESTKEPRTVPLEVSEDGFILEWTTRTPPGTPNRVAVKIADEDGLLMEETFETQAPDAALPLLREQTSEPGIAERDVGALPRTRVRASRRPSPGAELTGASVGPWALLKSIGSGGYGTVYDAQHEVTHFRCAVKVIPYDEEEVVAERLKRETRASNEFQHPALLPIMDAGLDPQQGVAYLAMRRLLGTPLAKTIGSKLSTVGSLELLRPVLEVLGVFHERGVVHRDVHPGNIYLADSGQVHLLDFGLCAIVGRRKVTQPATALGHLQYASPEQTMGSLEDSLPTADVWSLGVVLYELLTGEHPFERPTDIAVAAAAARDSHRPADELGVPAAIARVIDGCLHKSAEDRYPTARELEAALDTAMRAPCSR